MAHNAQHKIQREEGGNAQHGAALRYSSEDGSELQLFLLLQLIGQQAAPLT